MRVLGQDLERCAFRSKERVQKIQRARKRMGVKGTLREGGGGGGGEGGVEKERKRVKVCGEEGGTKGKRGGRVGRKRVQRRGRGRHLRAIIIIARHNSAGLSTSAGTDWAIGPRRWLVEGGGRGAPPHPPLGWDYWLRQRNER